MMLFSPRDLCAPLQFRRSCSLNVTTSSMPDILSLLLILSGFAGFFSTFLGVVVTVNILLSRSSTFSYFLTPATFFSLTFFQLTAPRSLLYFQYALSHASSTFYSLFLFFFLSSALVSLCRRCAFLHLAALHPARVLPLHVL